MRGWLFLLMASLGLVACRSPAVESSASTASGSAGDAALPPPPPVWTGAPEPASPAPPVTAAAEDAGSCEMPATCPPHAIDPLATLTLERTACFGTCPEYTVKIQADGTVTWQGSGHVDTEGHASARLPKESVRKLFELVNRTCFFSMQSEYHFPITDHPWANTTFTSAAGSKTVRHYLVDRADFKDAPGFCVPPRGLDELEAEIDRVAGTKRWIGTGGKKVHPGGKKSPGCNPPYVIEPNGVRRYKPECMR